MAGKFLDQTLLDQSEYEPIVKGDTLIPETANATTDALAKVYDKTFRVSVT